jgi:hypothetical protein
VQINWASLVVHPPSHNGDELILKNKAFSSKENAMEKEKVGCDGGKKGSSNFNPYMQQRALFLWAWPRRKLIGHCRKKGTQRALKELLAQVEKLGGIVYNNLTSPLSNRSLVNLSFLPTKMIVPMLL